MESQLRSGLLGDRRLVSKLVPGTLGDLWAEKEKSHQEHLGTSWKLHKKPLSQDGSHGRTSRCITEWQLLGKNVH